ncbi:bifunctional YncE family protein/alkaline phosphatase family protein [Daejeonella sp. H1SJ63]|uniref:bifunctional YncE family protein/alkaline phosphatase family protein n=1 Tax=Daejeonella sp. H1SJ63 TaxID=3034145 RepID=UPI0023EBC17D|nr:bifunctional YncE family protein/alkaline phosphatase family protein [Daejeonella sp. H1SJ63]
MNIKLKSSILSLVLIFLFQSSFTQSLTELEKKRVLLPNGWSLTPAGKNLSIGELPLNMAVTRNRKYMAITNNGQSTHTIDLIDIEKETRIDSIVIAKAWYGLAFSKDDQFLYASGGHDNRVNKYSLQNDKLQLVDSFALGKAWPNQIGTAGLDLEETIHHKLFVVTKEAKSLYVFNLNTKAVEKIIPLGAEAYACKLSNDRNTLYISLWGDKKVLFYDIKSEKIEQEISVGNHPNEMYLTRKGDYLYVANSDDNSVSIINTKTKTVVETLNAALYPDSPSGSTSNGLALSEDEKTLYIANADNNCLAVFDVSVVSESRSKGFIPVGWYPTNVKVIGKKIFVTNGKGLSSYANPFGPNPVDKKQLVLSHKADVTKPEKVQYIGSLFRGSLSIITEPSVTQLGIFSQAVYKNSPYSKSKELNAEGEPGNPVPMKVGDKSPIKHVFYIIKENRTYDQVLSDIPGGNGDTSLLLFGEKITPNQHKLARDYVLLDNFYVDAEVSADGHNWSMGAYANDYVEKNWPASYGAKGGTHGTSATLKIGNNKDGFIWDLCAKYNVSYRSYGEFVADDFGMKPRLESLKGHSATYAPYGLGVRDTVRFYQWKRDFDLLVENNAVPQFSTIRLGNNHTEGMRAGRPTPFAHVADNDLAVGMLIDHLSKSPVWKESVVFILEDDAQNGPDHVDAHRSPAFVIGPFVKRKYVDHTMYTTSGMLRTMELILGLPPMTQYDAAATPMWRLFTKKPDFTPYNHLPVSVDLNDKNPVNTKLGKLSEKFNWTREDAVPDLVFNEILWQGIKGKPAPSPVRAAFLKINDKEDSEK